MNKDQHTPPNQGTGRISHINEKEQEDQKDQYDISYVDQQEGEMNNGTLGGNFSKEEEVPERKDS